MRERFCRTCRGWHGVEAWPFECLPQAPQAQSTAIPVPYFISDTTEPLQHPIDGKFYTSKSTFSKITRQAGAIEVGNDPARLRPREKPKTDRKVLRDSLEKAKARYLRGERV